jgi:superfamily II DNA/RNA helicase
MESLSGGDRATPLQEQLLASGVLHSDANLIVRSPTNSGKSAVAAALMVEAVKAGGAAILIEPLRAIASERHGDLVSSRAAISVHLGRKARVRLTTGDTANTAELFDAPPPDRADLVVATPERLEVLWRGGDAVRWLESVRCLVVDEAHLLDEPNRGSTLDAVIGSFLSLPRPPRVVLMSATLSEVERLQSTLAPCDILTVSERTPPLQIDVGALGVGEDANLLTAAHVREALQDEANSALVFVSNVTSAESLAKLLSRETGSDAVAYHARLSAGEKAERSRRFRVGQARIAVSTTALAAGVNLPATHVVVRDTSLHGRERMSAGELLQMLGRAGRGERSGRGLVLLRPSDAWEAGELASAIDAGELGGRDRSDDGARYAMALLSRSPEARVEVAEIEARAARSLRGSGAGESVRNSLRWLAAPSVRLAHVEEGQVKLTALGRLGARSMLPLPSVAGFGRLLRDLIDADMIESIERMSALDVLAALLIAERPTLLLSSKKSLEEAVESWTMSGARPTLYREFVQGERGRELALDLVGALSSQPERDRVAAHKLCIRAFATVGVVRSLADGKQIAAVARQWGVADLEGRREALRDWAVFACHAARRLLDVRIIYFHLRERKIEQDRIDAISEAFERLRRELLALAELVGFSSPIGPLLAQVNRASKLKGVSRIGVRTLRALERSGLDDLSLLASKSVDEVVAAGVRRPIAERLHAALQRRV